MPTSAPSTTSQAAPAVTLDQALRAVDAVVAEFDFGGLGENSVDTEAIAAARELISKARGNPTPPPVITPIAKADLPRIGAPLLDGEFAGIVRGEEGDHALVLLAEAPKAMPWKRAMKWAEDQDASLPSRSEQSILFGNLRDRFQAEWYWSCEQYAGNESYAWYQDFLNGYQLNYRKDYELRARAVRRLPIQ